jgi:hypothetical protein
MMIRGGCDTGGTAWSTLPLGPGGGAAGTRTVPIVKRRSKTSATPPPKSLRVDPHRDLIAPAFRYQLPYYPKTTRPGKLLTEHHHQNRH